MTKTAVFCLILGLSVFANAQTTTEGFGKKINLEDVKIKGEVNKGQNMLNRRNKMNLDDRIKIPRDFRRAVLENLSDDLTGISSLSARSKK